MRLKQFCVVIPIALMLSACGGTNIFSPFQGTFVGTWSQSNPSNGGSASMLVLPGGSLSGVMHDNNANADYTISGTMSGSGAVQANLTPSGGTLSGNMGFNVSNQLIGTLTNSGGPFTSPSFNLTQQ